MACPRIARFIHAGTNWGPGLVPWICPDCDLARWAVRRSLSRDPLKCGYCPNLAWRHKRLSAFPKLRRVPVRYWKEADN